MQVDTLFADVDSVTADLGVSYVYVDTLEAPAAAQSKNGVRLIFINRGFLEKIHDRVLRTVAEAGLRFHEGCEHRYHNLPLRNEIVEQREKQGLNVSVWATIENIVGDVHIEAKGAKDYPNLLKYLSFVLTRLHRLRVQDEELPASESELDKALRKVVETLRKRNGAEVNPALIKTIHAFFEASRLGGVQKKHLDENVLKDLRFIIPRVFLARRGVNCRVVFQAADEIYHYLDRKYRIPPALSIGLVVSTPSSDGMPNEGDYEQVLPWRTIEDVKKDVEDAVAEAEKKLVEAERRFGEDSAPGGLLGGRDDAKVTPPTMRDIQFYVDTVQKHSETIRRLQSLFKRLAGKRWFVPAREGDLNTAPSVLQQAYVDSFKSGEDERDYYLVMRRAIPDLDLVLACDSSGSMFSSAEVVSEACICILEAAKRVGKIRTAVVSFGDGIRILKDFNEPVAAGRFWPNASGGTPLGSALEQALKFRWRWGNSIRHVLTVATDGYPDPDQWPIVDRTLLEMKKRRVIPIALCIGVEANEEYLRRFDHVYEVKETDGQLFSAFLDSFVKNTLLTPH
jgi:uncharacterized protein YegL